MSNVRLQLSATWPGGRSQSHITVDNATARRLLAHPEMRDRIELDSVAQHGSRHKLSLVCLLPMVEGQSHVITAECAADLALVDPDMLCGWIDLVAPAVIPL